MPPGCTAASVARALPPLLRETSGAAWSGARRGHWWTLNDSGNAPELYGFDGTGTLVARVRVAGATNRDWEDLAAGPCGDGAGNCLYLADIGDNEAVAGSVDVYRVPEPAPGDTVTAGAERFRARYPAGSRDAEALFVLPNARGGVEAYVITKGRRASIELYRFPLDAGAARAVTARDGAVTPTLMRVRELAPIPREGRDRVTGAGASPDGRWVAVRSYGALEIYARAALLGGGAPAFRASLAGLREPGGEAVALGGDGRVLLTTEGRPPMARVLDCGTR